MINILANGENSSWKKFLSVVLGVECVNEKLIQEISEYA